jgi:citrate lyase beta subunit
MARGPDAIVLDLEDAVPSGEKVRARGDRTRLEPGISGT